MKIRRYISVASILCLTLVMMLPSYASDLPEARAARYAGSSVACNVVITDANGAQEAYVIDVPIPTGATQAEESRLVNQAAYLSSTGAVSAFRAAIDTISQKTNLTIAPSLPYMNNVGGGVLGTDYSVLMVQFYGLYCVDMSMVIDVSISSLGSSGAGTYYDQISIAETPYNVRVYHNEDNVNLKEGNEIIVMAEPESAPVQIERCTVMAMPVNP